MKLAFMLTVTAYLIARVFAAAAGGPEELLDAAVYAVTATFGLEFLASTWQSRWNTP
jgi:hypothetical protein